MLACTVLSLPCDANQDSSKKKFFLDCAWDSLCISHSGKTWNLYLKCQSTNQSEAQWEEKKTITVLLLQLACTLLFHARILAQWSLIIFNCNSTPVFIQRTRLQGRQWRNNEHKLWRQSFWWARGNICKIDHYLFHVGF